MSRRSYQSPYRASPLPLQNGLRRNAGYGQQSSYGDVPATNRAWLDGVEGFGTNTRVSRFRSHMHLVDAARLVCSSHVCLTSASTGAADLSSWSTSGCPAYGARCSPAISRHDRHYWMPCAGYGPVSWLKRTFLDKLSALLLLLIQR